MGINFYSGLSLSLLSSYISEDFVDYVHNKSYVVDPFFFDILFLVPNYRKKLKTEPLLFFCYLCSIGTRIPTLLRTLSVITSSPRCST